MTDRERLIYLFQDINCKHYFLDNKDMADLADYLLENGVEVLPCKVGDTVYYTYEYGNKILEYKVKQVIINYKGKWLDVGVMWFSFEDVGKAVFLTREEAEQALKGSTGNENT